MKQYFQNIYHAVHSIFEGMAVTLSYLGRKPTTIQWPDRMEDPRPLEEQLPIRYRGILEVDMGLCSGCLSCQRDCPIGCIEIKIVTDPETKERKMTRFAIDTAKCMYCGLCTEHCPNAAIHHTREFAHSTPDMLDLVLEFIDEPVVLKKIVKGEFPEPLIKQPGDKVKALLAQKGIKHGSKPIPTTITQHFSERKR